MSAVDAGNPAISFQLNGKEVSVKAARHTRLSEVCRNQLAQTDVKVGCNAGDCGACTVLVDGLSVCACLTSIAQVKDKQVDTLQGLIKSDPLAHQLAEAFLRYGAAQCGICTPGMLVSACALLRTEALPTEQQVCDALGGVLCRCTGYRKIIDAVMYASQIDVNRNTGSVALAESDGVLKAIAGQRVNQADPVAGGVGIPIVRLDGKEKVDGTDIFGDDGAPIDALHCVIIRSPHHYAEFTIGDTEQYLKKHPEITCVLSAHDIPGVNRHGVIPPFLDQPVFAEQKTRFKGEAVAAVVGSLKALNDEAINDFPVQWLELVPALTPTQALNSDAELVHQDRQGNVMCRGIVKKGDSSNAIANSHTVVEGDYRTEFIEHAYIEPEAGFAKRVGERIEVHGCTQAPYMNRDSLADILGIDNSAVRIVPTSTGGGFGSKLDLSYQPFIALAAWVLNTTVRIAYTRRESMQSTTKRHPANMHVKVAADKNGKLTALEFDGEFNTGAYASWGPTVANRVPVHASGPYYVPNYQARSVAVHTHTMPAGAFRGFGVPQAAIAQECLFDELANKLQIDRLAFRISNALDNKQQTATGQVFETSVGIKPCLQSLESHWQALSTKADTYNNMAASQGTPVRRGVGVASGWYGCGNTSLPNPSCIKAGIRADGSVCLHQGAVDIGQGSNTVITQMFASALGVSVNSVVRISGDTDVTPDAGKTSASRQTFISGNAARLSGLALRAEILRLSNCQADSYISIAKDGIVIRDGSSLEQHIDLSSMQSNEDGYVLSAAESYDAPTKPLDENGQGEPYAVYGFAAHLVELDVDVELGTVKLKKFIAAHDVGKAINPNLIEGQIHGGIAQGIGLALMENYVPGVTENLHDYLIPTIGDVPSIESIIVEVHDNHGPYGAKGLGEHVLIPTAPSILNAIRHACGARVTSLPATPDKVLHAITKAYEAGQHPAHLADRAELHS